MVSVGKLKPGQANYYLDQAEPHANQAAALASGAEDYYVGGPEAAGRWLGRGAPSLALRGVVAGDKLTAILAGIDPASGMQLQRRGSVAGFDVTFSAPKSVSVLFGIGDEHVQSAIREAHEHAVIDAFGYFEDALSVARRGAGGHTRIGGNGLTAAAFLHRTSRAGDPQLHTHVLVANLIQGSDGQWSALDGRLVYAHARTAGFLYQAALRHELARSLGVRWRPVAKGTAEIDGVSSRVLRAFSRRRAEIEEALARHGSSGRDAAQMAALATRRGKDRDVHVEQLVPEWRSRAARRGLDAPRIARLISRSRSVEALDWAKVCGGLGGSEGLTRDRSSFGPRDVLQALSSASGQGAPVSEIMAVAKSFVRGPNAVRLLGAHTSDFEEAYSTPELLELERGVMQRAIALQRAGRGLAGAGATEQALLARPFLSGEQREMVRRLTRDGDGVAAVVGRAGTGKTTGLAAARDAWRQSGVPVRGCALGRRAARELEYAAGVRSTSVAAILHERRPLAPGTVLIVDEAGMLGTREFDRLLARVTAAEGKLVLAGDTRQLPSIRAGGALGALATRLDPIELRENRRQRETWEREAVELLRNRNGERALELYERQGRLRTGRHDEEVVPHLLADWHAYGDPDGSVIIAHYRADVAELNGRARALMRAAGQLGPDEVSAAGGAFASGDRVLVKRNDGRCDVRNGDRGVVERVDAPMGALSVRFDDRLVELDAHFLSRPTHDGRPALEHGYALTAYAAQGLTCRHALVLARDEAYSEWIYTTMTRASDANRLYVVGERGRERDEFAPAEPARDGRVLLAAALTRSRADELAIERLLPTPAERGLGREL
jgi:conjugative relaxase-like TrwC/TraI family protein